MKEVGGFAIAATPTNRRFSRRPGMYKINKNQILVIEGFGSMTPSLANFFYSLLWGTGLVLIPATVALIFISQKDKIKRT